MVVCNPIWYASPQMVMWLQKSVFVFVMPALKANFWNVLLKRDSIWLKTNVVSDKDFIEGEDIENEQNELYEMKSDFVFDVIQKDDVIALYSLLTH